MVKRAADHVSEQRKHSFTFLLGKQNPLSTENPVFIHVSFTDTLIYDTCTEFKLMYPV